MTGCIYSESKLLQWDERVKKRSSIHLYRTARNRDINSSYWNVCLVWWAMTQIKAHFRQSWIIKGQFRQRSVRYAQCCTCLYGRHANTNSHTESHTLSFYSPSLSPTPCWSNYVQCVSLLQAVWGWLMMLSAQGTCFNVRIISLLIYYIHWIGFNHY